MGLLRMVSLKLYRKAQPRPSARSIPTATRRAGAVDVNCLGGSLGAPTIELMLTSVLRSRTKPAPTDK